MTQIMRFVCAGPTLVFSLALLACDQGMSGKYGNDLMQVEFTSSTKAYMTMPGGSMMELNYKVDGDRIVLQNQAGNLVLTRNKDGTLSGAPGGDFAGPMKKLK